MSNSNQIHCPKCGTEIDVQDVLAHQVEESIKLKFQSNFVKQKQDFDAQQAKLMEEKESFELAKKRENELFQERLDQRMKSEKTALEEKLREKLRTEETELRAKLKVEQEEQFQALQKELNEKSEQIKELNISKAEIEKLKREKSELKEAVEAEAQQRLNNQLQEEKEKIRKYEEEKNELKFKELQKQLDDQKRLTEEMKRKQEQGSMQLQGEVQELAIEEWLQAQFPLDTIEEIKKGARGGDCIQRVHTRTQQNCGTIYYESKRTKDFQPSWIEKFKADIREKGCNIGVLVTDVRPSDMERMGMRDGIWICSYEEFKGLSAVLRESIIQVSSAITSQENKGDKMHLLYDFLTSTTFRMQVEAIVEGFSQLKSDLESEKRSMQRIWKQREKQLEKVIVNTIDMYGSIRGIAGNAVQEVKQLELPSDAMLDDEE
jgi:hypothetical protein